MVEGERREMEIRSDANCGVGRVCLKEAEVQCGAERC